MNNKEQLNEMFEMKNFLMDKNAVVSNRKQALINITEKIDKLQKEIDYEFESERCKEWIKKLGVN
jgi:hypothetical protein